MPALSFQEEWLNKLLRGDKQQTTRPQTDRIKVGDIVSMYNQQRRRIIDKPEHKLTALGFDVMHNRHCMSTVQLREGMFHAHLLGKVEISEVFDITPSEMHWQALEAWAWADGFKDFATARCWFEIRYGAQWMKKTWTVIRWDGWLERYFKPEE